MATVLIPKRGTVKLVVISVNALENGVLTKLVSSARDTATDLSTIGDQDLVEQLVIAGLSGSCKWRGLRKRKFRLGENQ